MKENEYTTPGLQEAMDKILDTICCADGGGSFVMLLNIIRKCDTERTEAAASVVEVVLKFGRMCKIADKMLNKQM